MACSVPAPVQMNSVGNSEFADDNYSMDEEVLSGSDSSASPSQNSTISEIIQGSNRLHIDVVGHMSSRTAERGFGALIGNNNSKRFALTKREVKMLNLPNAYNASGPHIVQQRAFLYKDEEDMLNEKKMLRSDIMKMKKENAKLKRYSEEIVEAIYEQKRVIAILARGKGLVDNERIRRIVGGFPDEPKDANVGGQGQHGLSTKDKRKMKALELEIGEQERVQRKLRRRLSDLSTLSKTKRKRMRDELESEESTQDLSDSNLSTALQVAIDNAKKQNCRIAHQIQEMRKSSIEEKKKRDGRVEESLTKQENLEAKLKKSKAHVRCLIRQVAMKNANSSSVPTLRK